MRASVFSHSPLLLLAAALVALAVVFVHDARPASADHEDTTILWHATLTVGSTGGSGCSRGVDDCRELLTDTQFTYEGTTYTVTNVDNQRDVVNAEFFFWLDKALPASLLSAGTLYVDGRALSLADFTHDPDQDRFYLGIHPSPRIPQWEPGQEVLLTLSGPRPPVWSATLTPQSIVGNGVGCLDAGGLNANQKCETASVLTENNFAQSGVEYTIHELRVSSGTLFISSLLKEFPQNIRSRGTLRVDGRPFSFATAGINSAKTDVHWPNSGLSWSAGDTIEISLTAPPPTGVEVSKERLDTNEGGGGSFTVKLTADPGSDLTVHLVRTQFFQAVGEPGHVWDQNAVTVSPESLDFTAGSSGNWNSARTVTVLSGTDTDTDDEQLMILVLVQTAPADGENQPEYGPVVGAYNSINGVHVTVTDTVARAPSIAPPTNVQAHAGRALSYDSHGNDLGRWLARFSWEAPGGSQTVTGYDFQWRREGGAWPAGVTSLSASDTSRIIRPNLGDRVNQSRGTVLGYRVRTRTADGASPWIEGTVTLDNPANLVRNLGVYASGQGELFASWASYDDWPAEDFDVQYKVAGASNWMSSDPEKGWVDAGYSGGTDELMTIQNLKDGTTYAVRVRVKSDWDFTWASSTTRIPRTPTRP